MRFEPMSFTVTAPSLTIVRRSRLNRSRDQELAHRTSVVAAGSSSAPTLSPAQALRTVLERSNHCVAMPACYDALSARLIAEAGCEAAFMSGYGVSASRYGDPDVGLVGLAEMADAGRACCRAAGMVPVIGDGDTGFGGPANVQRTVFEYHRAGFAAITIEDQVFPKRCAFAKGMQVVSRPEAQARLAAALDARDAIRTAGGDILVVGRTDCRLAANVEDGLQEALWRCAVFEDMGADIVYFEGPEGPGEMEELNRRITRTPTMLAQVEKPGRRPLSPVECADLGYDAALYGLTLLSASAAGVSQVLAKFLNPEIEHPSAATGELLPFDDLYSLVGFPAHYELEDRFSPERFGDDGGS